MLAILLAVLNTSAQTDLPRQWAHFSRSVSLRHASETVDIATGDSSGGSGFRYILRLTRRSLGEAPTVAWADSATCPAVRLVMLNMSKIPMPSPAPYGLPGQSQEIVMDGTRYSLTTPSSDSMGEFTISATNSSSLGSWVDDSLRRLEACWKPVKS